MCKITRVTITKQNPEKDREAISEVAKQFDADALFTVDDYQKLLDSIHDNGLRSKADDAFNDNFISVDIALDTGLIDDLTTEAEHRIEQYADYYVDLAYHLGNELGEHDLVTAGEVIDTIISMI